MRSFYIFSLFLALSTASAAQDFCQNFQHYNNDITATQSAFDENSERAAWQWFVCLNQKTDNGEYVWENFRSTLEVFLDNGATPAGYQQKTTAPAAVVRQFTEKFGDISGTIHNLDLDIQVDGFDLKDKQRQPIRYQMLMNQAAFDYIVAKQAYNLDGQAQLAANNENLIFPPTSWELKLSWFWIGDDYQLQQRFKKDKYITVPAYYEHDRGFAVGYAALGGMHIVNRLLPNWTWSTFEHRYNRAYLAGAVENITGPKPAASEQNTIFQQRHPDLENYQLIGVQSDFTQGNAGEAPKERPEILANAQMESAFQQQSSCIACHQRAAINEEGAHLSYAIGWENDRLLFPTDAMEDGSYPDYSRLDFVWSLRNAQWLRQ